MSFEFENLIQPLTVEATGSAARLRLIPTAAGAEIVAIRGQVHGPRCLWARTLPASFNIASIDDSHGRFKWAEVLIADPCYWSPAMPFQYQFEATVEMADGSKRQIGLPISVRQWWVDLINLRRGGKRVVIRGAGVGSAGGEEFLQQVRNFEFSVMPNFPDAELCRDASRIGVSVIINMNRVRGDWEPILRRLAWQPSVDAVIVTSNAPASLLDTSPPTVALHLIGVSDSQPTELPPWVNAFAVQLWPGERPPAWLAHCGRPVVAIRRGISVSAFGEERNECDRLQAELAPQFDLAGYVIAT